MQQPLQQPMQQRKQQPMQQPMQQNPGPYVSPQSAPSYSFDPYVANNVPPLFNQTNAYAAGPEAYNSNSVEMAPVNYDPYAPMYNQNNNNQLPPAFSAQVNMNSPIMNTNASYSANVVVPVNGGQAFTASNQQQAAYDRQIKNAKGFF